MRTHYLPWRISVLFLVLMALVLPTFGGPGKWPVDKDANAVFQVIKTGELVGLGARRPTDEEWAWGENNMIKTRDVKLNKLGLETTSCCSGHGKSMAQLAFKVEDAAIYIHQGRISINWWRNKKSK